MSKSHIKRAGGDVGERTELTLSDSKASSASERGWLKATLPVALIAAFAELGLAVINNEFQVYIPKGLGLGTVIMGAVMVPFFISEVVFKSPLGVLADRWGRKPLMVLGPAISIFTPLVLASINYPPRHVVIPLLLLFGFLRLLDGLGAASLWPAMFAYIGDHVPEGKRASAMSLLNVTYMFGLALGFLAGGWVNDTFGPVLTGQASLKMAVDGVYAAMQRNARARMIAIKTMHFPGVHHFPSGYAHLHLLAQAAHQVGLPVALDRPAQFHPSFYLGSVLFAIATCVALLTLKDKRAEEQEGILHHSEQSPNTSEKFSWQDFIAAVRTVPQLMIIALVTFMGMGCIMLLVKVFALDELGITETQFGLLVLWPALLIGIVAVPLGHMSDKIGKEVSIKIGFCTGASGMWLLVFLYGSTNTMYAGLLCGASLLGIGFVLAFPAWMALLTSIGNQSRRGTIIGAVSTAQGVGAAIGIGLGNWLYEDGGIVWVHIGKLFGERFDGSSHIAHIAPFAASAVLLAISALLTLAMIKPAAKPGLAAPSR